MTYPPVELDPYSKAFLAKVPKFDFETISLEEVRGLFPKVPLTGVHLEEKYFTSREGRDIKVEVLRPYGTEEQILPAIIFLHGGGWVMGDINTHAEVLPHIVNGTNAAVLYVNYTLSPEVRHPVALEECYDALNWCIKESSQLKIDPEKIAIGGDSAGGNLSAALCLLVKQRSNKLLSAIRYQFLLYPAVDDNFETASYLEYQEDYFLTQKAMMYFLPTYAGNEEDRKNILVCPLKATLDDLKGLPPALVMTAEADVLRDEGEAYARRLVAAGVPATAMRYQGCLHGFMSLSLQVPAAKAGLLQLVSLLKEAFDVKKSD
ncbi:hypothetical protein EC973_008663 [Apophysomyces ossiformis]|uniref:Alpha/beta hydrolase fold-3 domain-containing protein n=1 Tax=Apophysomyces ossiformis TaxID=679940 RepID=A0A8H7BML1_9FUNG|nr:hypothetical protein EC973_008663 [Apophysomyces ossiformis]